MNRITKFFEGSLSGPNLTRVAIGLVLCAAASFGFVTPAEASFGGFALIFGTENLIKAYKAGAQISPYTIVKWDTVDFQVIPAAAATDKLVGVAVPNITAPSGQRVDVIKGGIAQVVLGGTVTRGDAITSNASGAGVLAAPGAGVNNRIVGYAEMSGVSGDIIPVMINCDTIQG